MHVVGFFTREIDDVAFCDAAQRRGISLRPLSIYYLQTPKRSGLILGFAATPSSRIIAGVERLSKFAAEFLGVEARPYALPPLGRVLSNSPLAQGGAARRVVGV
jgi:hypothetical protein